MHFFYLDETGFCGERLDDPNRPIFVLGGVSVRDESWNKFTEEFQRRVAEAFGGGTPDGFELHAHELLSRDGKGPFSGWESERRQGLALSLLDAIVEQKHGIQYCAVDCAKLQAAPAPPRWIGTQKVPYLLAYDYLVTATHLHVKRKLGASARGMIIVDTNDQVGGLVSARTQFRRRKAPKASRPVRVVEFTHPVDSSTHPMVQLSDLIVLCVRKFLESECGYKPNWAQPIRQFYANCYAKVDGRLLSSGTVRGQSAEQREFHAYLGEVAARPGREWRQRFGL